MLGVPTELASYNPIVYFLFWSSPLVDLIGLYAPSDPIVFILLRRFDLKIWLGNPITGLLIDIPP